MLETAHPDTLTGGCPEQQFRAHPQHARNLLIRTPLRRGVRMSSFEHFRERLRNCSPDTLSGGCPDERFRACSGTCSEVLIRTPSREGVRMSGSGGLPGRPPEPAPDRHPGMAVRRAKFRTSRSVRKWTPQVDEEVHQIGSDFGRLPGAVPTSTGDLEG